MLLKLRFEIEDKYIHKHASIIFIIVDKCRPIFLFLFITCHLLTDFFPLLKYLHLFQK